MLHQSEILNNGVLNQVSKKEDVFKNVDEKMELSAADNESLLKFETVKTK